MTYTEIKAYIEKAIAEGKSLHGKMREWAIDLQLDKMDQGEKP